MQPILALSPLCSICTPCPVIFRNTDFCLLWHPTQQDLRVPNISPAPLIGVHPVYGWRLRTPRQYRPIKSRNAVGRCIQAKKQDTSCSIADRIGVGRDDVRVARVANIRCSAKSKRAGRWSWRGMLALDSLCATHPKKKKQASRSQARL